MKFWKTWHVRLILVASTLFLTQCGSESKSKSSVEELINPHLFGKWISTEDVIYDEKYTARGTTQAIIEITEDTFNLTMLCKFNDNVELEAKTSSKIEITDTHIRTFGSELVKKEVQTDTHILQCTAGIPKTLSSWSLKSDRVLSLSLYSKSFLLKI